MPTALFYNVFSQVSLPESRAFCPKNYIVSAAGGPAAPPAPPDFKNSLCAFGQPEKSKRVQCIILLISR